MHNDNAPKFGHNMFDAIIWLMMLLMIVPVQYLFDCNKFVCDTSGETSLLMAIKPLCSHYY